MFKLISIFFLVQCFILTMWYVNGHYVSNTNGELICFILTMWYVNAKSFNITENDNIGFILTMWYVNKSNHVIYFLLTKVLY